MPLLQCQDLLDSIYALGPRLELLSLHMSSDSYATSPLSRAHFKGIYEACPSLRQLGYQLDEDAYIHELEDESENDYEYDFGNDYEDDHGDSFQEELESFLVRIDKLASFYS